VTDATVYFIMAMCIQTLVLFFLSFADVRRRPLPILTPLTHLLPAHDESVPTYVRTLSPDLKSLTNPRDLVVSIQCEFPWNFRCYGGPLTPMTISLIPILINRGVLSLKRTADVNSTVSRAWSTGHFSNMRFEPMSMTVASETVVGQPLTENQSDTYDHNDVPLDDLTLRKRSRSSPITLGVAL